jgi:hypothetical protein
MKSIALVLVSSIGAGFTGLNPACMAQTRTANTDVFEKIEMLGFRGDRVQGIPARLRLEADSLIVESRKSRATMTRFRYSEIMSASYSVSRHPRRLDGVGLVAASSLGSLLPLALPLVLSFSKSRKHWLTIRTNDEHLVLRLDKRNRQVVIPAFEGRSGIKVVTMEDKIGDALDSGDAP